MLYLARIKDAIKIAETNESISGDKNDIKHIEQQILKEDQIYMIVLNETFDLMGYSRFGICDSSEVNIGIVLMEKFWNNGEGSVILEELISISKKLGFIKMSWTSKPENEGSVQFAQNHGFRKMIEDDTKVRLIKEIV